MPTIDDLKLHCRIDGDDEDALLQAVLDAATDAAADYLNLPTVEIVVDMPAPVHAAILLAAADLYANRERQGEKAYFANLTYERLLAPYRVMGV